MKIQTSALIGLGAVGTVYGTPLIKTYGNNFAVIAAGSRGEKLRAAGVTHNGEVFHPQIATPDAPSFRPDLLIVAVKNTQLDSAIADMRPFVGKDTLILPLLNGISARERLQEAFPESTVFYGLTRVGAVRTAEGVTNGSRGIIQFGHAGNAPAAPEVLAVQEYLTGAEIASEICEDMVSAQWAKWMLNVGCNQVSAITRADSGHLLGIETNYQLFIDAMLEVVELAKVCKVNITEEDALHMAETMRKYSPPHAKTSMLQDVEARRLTEVDYFSGTVLQLGKEKGVPTPVNHVLYCLIRSIEQMY